MSGRWKIPVSISANHYDEMKYMGVGGGMSSQLAYQGKEMLIESNTVSP